MRKQNNYKIADEMQQLAEILVLADKETLIKLLLRFYYLDMRSHITMLNHYKIAHKAVSDCMLSLLDNLSQEEKDAIMATYSESNL